VWLHPGLRERALRTSVLEPIVLTLEPDPSLALEIVTRARRAADDGNLESAVSLAAGLAFRTVTPTDVWHRAVAVLDDVGREDLAETADSAGVAIGIPAAHVEETSLLDVITGPDPTDGTPTWWVQQADLARNPHLGRTHSRRVRRMLSQPPSHEYWTIA